MGEVLGLRGLAGAPMLAIELPRLRVGVCDDQRLLILSERLIIALCTNPPMPFVGDGGRSEAKRFWLGDIATLAASASKAGEVDGSSLEGGVLVSGRLCFPSLVAGGVLNQPAPMAVPDDAATGDALLGGVVGGTSSRNGLGGASLAGSGLGIPTIPGSFIAILDVDGSTSASS